MPAIVIDIDECKKKIPGYTPTKATEYHTESAKIADKLFKNALSKKTPKKVILMCGGSASGKSELVSSELINEEAIIYDSTLHTQEGAKVKIRNSVGKGKLVEVCALLPESISKSFGVFLTRERQIPVKIFYVTHVGSRQNLLWIAKNFPQVKIRIYIGKTDKYNKLQVFKYNYNSQSEIVKFIEEQQLSESDIINLVSDIKQ
ncbi:hypothetical protein KJ953_04230 [Patescibacteria group bacterium]|nr:hypothetical protein [Patescibacteria group bacterium]MBU1256114.1 hypothetical protein [Patescibacteria group bacterium]MBU1457194.1 hypothetical protein [Patescibacteria group bacterium]